MNPEFMAYPLVNIQKAIEHGHRNSGFSDFPIQNGWIFPLLQEEQSLCFLKALQNIHFGQPRITFSSPFCVAGVGRSIITLF